MTEQESFDTIRALIHEHGPAKANRIVQRSERAQLAGHAPGAPDAAGPKVDDTSEHAAQ